MKKEESERQDERPRDVEPRSKSRRRDRVSVNEYTNTVPKDPILIQYHQGKLASPLRT